MSNAVRAPGHGVAVPGAQPYGRAMSPFRSTIQYAPFACRPEDSRGRLHAEPESAIRTPFQRDRDRVIHSTAFRRLKHKTQVFVAVEGDHYRTRLTHSLEVSQIARTLCRVLGLNEDLAEAVALAHDLGHPPFGHAGEEALDEAMADYGGFDHNAQTLRILTRLESRYASFDGLNLSWETLEGTVKHNGPLTYPGAPALPAPIVEYVARHDLELHTYPSAEAQVAALADDIAYCNHDLDDGLRAGLFALEDLETLPHVHAVFDEVRTAHGSIETPRQIHEGVRRLIDRMVGDLLATTTAKLERAKPGSATEIRALGAPVVALSERAAAEMAVQKKFLFDRMYRHYKVNRMTDRARRVVHGLFGHFFARPQDLPAAWQGRIDRQGTSRSARVVADYIAGMTDTFALDTHRRLSGRDEP